MIARLSRLFAFFVALALLGGCTWWDEWQAKREIRAALQATNGDLQQKRSLLVSEQSLRRLDRTDVVVNIPKAEVDQLAPLLLEELQQQESLKDHAIEAKALRLGLADQEITFELDLFRKLGPAAVTITVGGSGAVGGGDGGLALNLIARTLTLQDLEIDKGGILTDDVKLHGIELLRGLRGIANAALDAAINRNPKKAVFLKLDQNELLKLDTTKTGSGSLTFQPKVFKTAMRLPATAALIEEGRIVVAAKAEFVAPPAPGTEPSPKPIPALDDLLDIPQNEARSRSRAYQARVRAMVEPLLAEAQAMPTETSLLVTKAAASRMLAHAFSQLPLDADLTLSQRVEGEGNLTFSIKEKSCSDFFNGCKFKDTCSGDRCEKKVNKQFKGACEAAKKLLGKIVGGACETVTKAVVEPIGGATCDAFRGASNATGGALCDIASNIDKASCDVGANLSKSACDVQQEVGRFYRHNPIATLDAAVAADGVASASLLQAAIGADLQMLEARIAAKGEVNVEANLKYRRKTATDAVLLPLTGGLCTFNWSEKAKFKAKLHSKEYAIRFQMTKAERDGEALRLTYRQVEDVQIKVDFSPSPLNALFGNNPHLILNCPTAVIGSFVMGTAEAVLQPPEARKVLPALTGEDFPHTVKEEELAFAIPPLQVCRTTEKEKCDQNKLVLLPSMTAGLIAFKSAPATP